MFHVDQIHVGPLGTYLQGLVVHHTLFGVLPPASTAVQQVELWINQWMISARRFQPIEHHRDPFPTRRQAEYLYNIAVRICIRKQLPKTFRKYTNGEATDYDPIDDIYKVDDLF
jgi:hypothetical protein